MITQQLTSLIVRGIGIDAVEIARFTLWHTYSDKKLSRIFSTEEIAYCRACAAKNAERFAARFAAREALYKALCQAYPDQKFLFLTLCKHVKITHGSHGQPELTVNWQNLTHKSIQSSGDTTLHDKSPRILLSLTHTDTLAMAWVVAQELFPNNPSIEPKNADLEPFLK